MSLRVNPEYEKLLPKMSDEEFAEFKASIQTEGQHYPIVVNEDLEILDGHHRFRACVELGIEPDFEVRKFEDKLLERKFVIEANLRRRHLTKFQLVELGVPLLEIERELVRKRQAPSKSPNQNMQLDFAPEDAKPVFKKTEAVAKVAKKVGVSPRTFERGRKILEKASEEDKQKLREGKTSITRVYRELVASEDAVAQTAGTAEATLNDVRRRQNERALAAFLKRLLEGELFCPACGNVMFECSKCHKTLEELLKPQGENKESS
ncbi:MAG: ParB N-terminal domain-containing protein [Candidatus Bathyarchaeota archaeon]|nr:ParB N-terminal domain-containing protein [Candidatus Bathyarchaeota archaeon]